MGDCGDGEWGGVSRSVDQWVSCCIWAWMHGCMDAWMHAGMGEWGGGLIGSRLLIRRACNIPWDSEYLTWYFFHTRSLRFFPMTNDQCPFSKAFPHQLTDSLPTTYYLLLTTLLPYSPYSPYTPYSPTSNR